MAKALKKRKPNPDVALEKVVRAFDKLVFYEELESKLSPELWKDIEGGKSPDEIFEKWESYAAGRMVQNAVFEPDTAKSTAAAKDILDRKMGKAVEKKTVEHRLGKLPDHELRALVQSKIQDVTPKKPKS